MTGPLARSGFARFLLVAVTMAGASSETVFRFRGGGTVFASDDHSITPSGLTLCPCSREALSVRGTTAVGAERPHGQP